MIKQASSSTKQVISVRSTARNNLDWESSSQFTISSLSPLGRLIAATKALTLAWGVALLCVLVPGFHFILVPSGLVVGVFLFYRRLGFRQYLHEGQILCPKCQHEFPAKKGAFNWPRLENCPRCGCDFSITAQL